LKEKQIYKDCGLFDQIYNTIRYQDLLSEINKCLISLLFISQEQRTEHTYRNKTNKLYIEESFE